jgi:hypothetical protein
MRVRHLLTRAQIGPVLFCLGGFAVTGAVNTDYITPEFTFSPDHRYAVRFQFGTTKARRNRMTE